MTGRRLIASAFIVAALALSGICAGNSCVCAVFTAAGRIDAVERCRTRARRTASSGMGKPHARGDQREHVLENYRRWQSMRPEERQKVQRNFQTFPQSAARRRRKRVLEGLRRWRQLPPASARNSSRTMHATAGFRRISASG